MTPGTIYRHLKSGRLYRIICLAKDESSLALMVVYTSNASKDGNGNWSANWTRPYSEFKEKFEFTDMFEFKEEQCNLNI